MLCSLKECCERDPWEVLSLNQAWMYEVSMVIVGGSENCEDIATFFIVVKEREELNVPTKCLTVGW